MTALDRIESLHNHTSVYAAFVPCGAGNSFCLSACAVAFHVAAAVLCIDLPSRLTKARFVHLYQNDLCAM